MLNNEGTEFTGEVDPSRSPGADVFLLGLSLTFPLHFPEEDKQMRREGIKSHH